MALVISAAGGRQLRQTEHLHRWLAVTHEAKAKLTHLWISECRQVLERRWSQVTNESTRWDGAQGGEKVFERSEVKPLWNWEAVGAASTRTPRIVTNCSFFLWCPTSWRSVRNFKTRTVISPQSEPMLMMHEGHYVHIQTSSSSFLFFTRWGWATLRQRLDGGPLALCSHIK